MFIRQGFNLHRWAHLGEPSESTSCLWWGVFQIRYFRVSQTNYWLFKIQIKSFLFIAVLHLGIHLIVWPVAWKHPSFSWPRVYPTGFGQSLAEALREWRPQPTLRQKVQLDLIRTDRELFAEIPISDVWDDAGLPRVYWYLRTMKCLKIPASWDAEFQK